MTCENRLNSVTTNKIYFHWGPVCCLKLFTQWFCAHCRFNNEKLLETHPSALYISQQQLGKHVFSSLCLPSPSCSFFQSIRTMCLGADQYLSSCVSYSCALWNISISCSHLSPMQTLFFFFIFAGCSAFDSEKPQNNPFFSYQDLSQAKWLKTGLSANGCLTAGAQVKVNINQTFRFWFTGRIIIAPVHKKPEIQHQHFFFLFTVKKTLHPGNCYGRIKCGVAVDPSGCFHAS